VGIASGFNRLTVCGDLFKSGLIHEGSL